MNMPLQGTVFIVDDDASVRDSTALYLSLKGFQTRIYACGDDFLSSLPDEPLGCALLDIQMPGMSGLQVQERLAQEWPHLPVIFMTAYGDVATVRHCLKSGAADFIEKPIDHPLLVGAVAKALEQQATIVADRHRGQETRQRLERLTPRENEVMRLLSLGLQNREIAAELSISPRTVEVYKARLMDKLQTRSLAALVRIALDRA